MGGYELLDKTWVLCKSSKHSQLLSHLSSSFCILHFTEDHKELSITEARILRSCILSLSHVLIDTCEKSSIVPALSKGLIRFLRGV